jgi:hypothetical protein
VEVRQDEVGRDDRCEEMIRARRRLDPQRVEEAVEERCHRRLADPAEAEGRHRDPELRRRDVVVDVARRAQDQPSRPIALRRGRLQPTLAQAHQRELGGDEESVRQDEDDDRREPDGDTARG